MAMLLDTGDLAAQVRGEAIHLTFLAIVGGFNLVLIVVGFLLRRDLRRSDEDKEAMAAEIIRVDNKVDALDHRHGYEISDIRTAVAPLFSRVGIDQPVYPSR